MFSALEVRNFRLFFAAQTVSSSGAWIQRVAQAWLVLDLTGSGTALGGVAALQFVPLLLGAPFGGVIADRVDKRWLLIVTNAAMALISAALALLILADQVELWMIYAFALVMGSVAVFNNPARQTFVIEMVGRDRLVNALGLNSVVINTARIIGPAIAGVLILSLGVGICFLLNAASFLAPVLALALIRTSELERAEPQPRQRGQLRAGAAYAAATPLVRIPLLMTVAVGIFSFQMEVALPLLARFTFGGDADTFGLMLTAMGIGAVVGGLHTASRTDRKPVSMVWLLVVWGAATGLIAAAPSLWVALLGLTFVGGAGTSFLAFSNSLLQLHSKPEMRGRVVALRAMAFPGTRPLGAPIVGAVGEYVGPRYALAMGAVVALLAAGVAYRPLSRLGPPS